MKIISPFSFQFSDECCESNTGEIMTVPGQAQTPAELLRRFRVGMPLDGKIPIYEDDTFEDEDNPMRNPDFDLTDIPVYVRKIEERKRFSEQKEKERAEGEHHSPEPDRLKSGELPEGAGGAQKAP